MCYLTSQAKVYHSSISQRNRHKCIVSTCWRSPPAVKHLFCSSHLNIYSISLIRHQTAWFIFPLDHQANQKRSWRSLWRSLWRWPTQRMHVTFLILSCQGWLLSMLRWWRPPVFSCSSPSPISPQRAVGPSGKVGAYLISIWNFPSQKIFKILPNWPVFTELKKNQNFDKISQFWAVFSILKRFFNVWFGPAWWKLIV